MLIAILTVELLVVGISAVFLCPVMIVQALSGHWLGVRVYARAACWGGAFLIAALVAVQEIAR